MPSIGFAVERRGAIGCGEDAVEHIEQRRLAGSVGADDAEDLARADLETDPADRAQAAERSGQVRHAQKRCRAGPAERPAVRSSRRPAEGQAAVGLKKRSRIVQNNPSGAASMMRDDRHAVHHALDAGQDIAQFRVQRFRQRHQDGGADHRPPDRGDAAEQRHHDGLRGDQHAEHRSPA